MTEFRRSEMKCYDCGKEMVPVSFARNLDGTPWYTEFPGYAAGEENPDGEIWVKCPDGHRGHWEKVQK